MNVNVLKYDIDKTAALAEAIGEAILDAGVTVAETLVALGAVAAGAVGSSDGGCSETSIQLGLSLMGEVMRHGMTIDGIPERYDA